ncbi:MAG TPA: hypothetical protein VHU44_10495 [Acidobacteriaceae bacterium]|nr:hypothetical protein [Acidobacteriaceae bacterium]
MPKIVKMITAIIVATSTMTDVGMTGRGISTSTTSTANGLLSTIVEMQTTGAIATTVPASSVEREFRLDTAFSRSRRVITVMCLRRLADIDTAITRATS